MKVVTLLNGRNIGKDEVTKKCEAQGRSWRNVYPFRYVASHLKYIQFIVPQSLVSSRRHFTMYLNMCIFYGGISKQMSSKLPLPI